MKYDISSRMTCPVFLCMFLALSLFPTDTNADDTARQLESQVLDVRLHGALFKGEGLEADGPTLMLDLAQEEGRWRRVWAVARDYNAAFQIGTVTASEVSPSKLELAVRLKIQGDSFGAGGRAMYRIELNRRHDGAFKGSYSGTFNGMAVKGKAEADFRPSYRRMIRNYRPFGPREHPRILFRKEELPELREKANTPFGKAALEAMDSTEGKAAVIGKALKYQLTGDVKYADQIIPIIEEMTTRGHLSDQFGNNVGDRLEKMALAYDVCYDVWRP